MQETWVQFLGQEDMLEKEMATIPVFLPGEFHGQKSPVGYSPWGQKSQAWLSDLYFYTWEIIYKIDAAE